jgi:hypothetical protein
MFYCQVLFALALGTGQGKELVHEGCWDLLDSVIGLTVT